MVKLSRFFGLNKLRNREGMILPLAVMLVIMLSISGTSFLQHDYLERRMAMTERDYQNAFWLASAGLERSLVTLNSQVVDGTVSWDNVFTDQPAVAHADLCGAGTSCVVPPFQTVADNAANVDYDGEPIYADSGDLPFESTFASCDNCGYEARAFGNMGTASVTVRSQGFAGAQSVMLEASVTTVSGMKLINCQNDYPDGTVLPNGTVVKCPDARNNSSLDGATIENIEGKDPASVTQLPTWNADYYRDPANLPCSNVVDIDTEAPGVSTLISSGSTPADSTQMAIASDTCYFSSKSLELNSIGVGYSNIVVFSEEVLLVKGNTEFVSNTVLIGGTDVQLQGNVTTHAPMPMPAVISGGDITKGDASVEIYGNVFAAGDIGDSQHPWNPNEVHGTIIGDDVWLKAASTYVSDDGNLDYYQFMPGFTYHSANTDTQYVPGTWRQL